MICPGAATSGVISSEIRPVPVDRVTSSPISRWWFAPEENTTGPKPVLLTKVSFASTLRGEAQGKAGRPGRDAMPAKQGVILVPSGGKLLFGAVVRTMIQ